MNSPLKRLIEISNKHCSDYPNIKTCNAFERLYAVESTLEGISAANAECHQMIQILAEKLNLSSDDLFKLWETEVSK